jgi:methionyl-tRNA synthetase
VSNHDSSKPFFITTPIFYVNADAHVGHFYSMVLADVIKRFQDLKGRPTVFSTGTDEHGMKIQQAAAKAGQDPQAFCDAGAKNFEKLASRAGLSNTIFFRTTNKEHREAVQHIWRMLVDKGLVYTALHEGWYSVSDEAFYPQSAVRPWLDPRTGVKMMVSVETGKEVEWTSEVNYHFRMSAMKDKLLDFYKQNPKFVTPESRMAEVIAAVSSGLEDLSISRPAARLSWGIPVPDDESQTIYVWIDALINYITQIGYPWAPGNKNSLVWPPDVQIIGKDILRFHAIYWPALLLALNLEPPRQLLCHAHWTLAKRKMSKSVGNVVNPFFAIDRFGVDTMRYYLTYDGGIANDSDYENSYIYTRYSKILRGQLGNLAARIIRTDKWSVSQAVLEHGATSDLSKFDDLDKQLVSLLQSLSAEVEQKMTELSPGGALRVLEQAISEANVYITKRTPWDTIKQSENNPSMLSRTNLTVYLCAEALRIVGILLQPVMPSKTAELLDYLGVKEDRRGFEHAQFGQDAEYGENVRPPPKDPKMAGILFPEILKE